MIREEDARFIHLEKTVGIFVALAILGVIAVVVSIGIDRDLFAQKYQLKFTVEKGTGFSRGMPVKLSGFRIGRIKSIALNQQAQVDIDIEIDKKYQKWIKRDSRVRLIKEGLVGDNIIEVSVGSPQQAMLKNGEVIAYLKSKGLEEVANDIADQVKPVLLEVKEIISYVNDPEGDIKQSLSNLRELSQALHGTRVQLDSLLIEAKGKVSAVGDGTEKMLKTGTARLESMAPAIEKADRSLEHLDGSLAEVRQSLPHLFSKIGATLSHLEKTSGALEKNSSRFLEKVAPLLGRSTDLVEDADDVARALKQTWPLKNHIPTAKDLVPGESHD